MESSERTHTVLVAWRTLLGDHPKAEPDPERGLWSVIATDSRRYVLKRLSPWRNLPIADEARVLRHLATNGVPVAEFMITEQAALVAGDGEHSYVLMPWLPTDVFASARLVDLDEVVGAAVAELHRALAAYPWPIASYREHLVEALNEELALPPDVQRSFAACRDEVAGALADLPLQTVHGDLTPDNVLVRQPGRVSGFIDLDHLPRAPRVWDVGKYLSRRFRRTGRDASFTPADGLRHLIGFLRGYQATDPLSAAELAAIPAAALAGNLIEASYNQRILSGDLDRRRLSGHEDVLRDTIEAARWQLAHREAVAAAVRTIS